MVGQRWCQWSRKRGVQGAMWVGDTADWSNTRADMTGAMVVSTGSPLDGIQFKYAVRHWGIGYCRVKQSLVCHWRQWPPLSLPLPPLTYKTLLLFTSVSSGCCSILHRLLLLLTPQSCCWADSVVAASPLGCKRCCCLFLVLQSFYLSISILLSASARLYGFTDY